MTARRPLLARPMRWLWPMVGVAAAVGVMGLSYRSLTAPPEQTAKTRPVVMTTPQRVVSLDFCADQFVLELADRNQIAALSTQSRAEHAYWRKEAVGLPQVRSSAEAVLALSPDLVVRTYGGGPGAGTVLDKAGVPVLQLGEGEDFEAVRGNLRLVARALGHADRGEAAVARFDQALAKAHRTGAPVSALYVTPGGVQAGRDTSLGKMMAAAGLTPFDQAHTGWSALPLERLARSAPSLMISGFMSPGALALYPWSSARHPLIRAHLAQQPSLALSGGVSACPGSFMADGVLDMAKAGDPLRKAAS